MYSTKDKVLDAIASVALVATFIALYIAASLADLAVTGL